MVGRADLDHFAHELVAEHVAAFHAEHLPVHEVQVRAADRATAHLEDDVARILDLQIGHRIAPDVALAMPAQCPHAAFLSGGVAGRALAGMLGRGPCNTVLRDLKP